MVIDSNSEFFKYFRSRVAASNTKNAASIAAFFLVKPPGGRGACPDPAHFRVKLPIRR
jgi:hypothetical protein